MTTTPKIKKIQPKTPVAIQQFRVWIDLKNKLKNFLIIEKKFRDN